ncbi:msl9587 (plasmid) [Mesorhizobium japonicum MAFF 303099]|uniref:Msl9587 protein n=1 Tax=Mesorhizobium japonicum (strain LMG 29417 / CECT 9101 / MAFF 303099) TaxID=266835 RepID=Q98P72_RHILO|nr:msl9587 [Mesorhizobium japonicum MAFF 303099]
MQNVHICVDQSRLASVEAARVRLAVKKRSRALAVGQFEISIRTDGRKGSQ